MIQQIRLAMAQAMCQDAARLTRRLRALEAGQRRDIDAELAALRTETLASVARAQARLECLPVPSFDDLLPVSSRRADIAQTIARHQVVILCGETGSGKTTQLPKICLELKRGARGMIGCTQPRRIAARSVAARIAQELGTPVGKGVGFKVRFTDRVDESSYVKVMTDGVLLAEIHGDRGLHAYDTIIIDEAHERSLNIDFLLGYLKRLLPRRPELKVIVTSATIDADRFSRHFEGAPVLEVSGRTYPVEVRYRPVGDEDDEVNLNDAIAKSIDELWASGGPGDVLVFLPGEREIREAAEALRKHHPPGIEVLPLYARLTVAEQDRIFEPGAANRIVLATNVAETSLTVPRIRYVVDTGLARLNRYSPRTKVNLLQIEKISQASAKQRSGRCGRVQSGVCIRLYSEEDFNARSAYTTPEIMRTSLAAVILRMHALKLGDVSAFDFLEAPSPKAIEAGYQLLAELGAINELRALTQTGIELAKLPVDPKVARMLLAARDSGCLREMLIIAAALSTQDPRDRPADKREAAAEKHRQFRDERSDFMGYLKLWEFFDQALRHKKSNRKLAQSCRDNFLSHLRLREWRDIHGQLHTLVTEMGMRVNTAPAEYQQLHEALLRGLLGHIGMKDPEGDSYLGARDTKFWLTPDSVFAKQKPRWVMVAELVDTTRLYGRCAGKIEPDWIERAAGTLVKRTYFEPHWERRSGQVMAFERVTLYGLILVAQRKVGYGQVDPAQARDIFIRSALVAGDMECRAEFFKHNFALIAEIETLEDKSRRQDVLVDEETIHTFYNELIPAGICSAAAFERWRKNAERANPKLLYLTREYLMRHGADHVTQALYPDSITIHGASYPLTYRFEPTHPFDGVTLTVAVASLHQLHGALPDWLVPGLIREKVTAHLKGLPQRYRRMFVPVNESVTGFLEWADRIEREKTSLAAALSEFALRERGTDIAPAEWRIDNLPDHLRMNYRVLDDKGVELAAGRDLERLRSELQSAARQSLRSNVATGFERTGLLRWDFGDLPVQLEQERNGRRYLAFPGLEDCGNSVTLRLFETLEKAELATRWGEVRLFRFELKEQIKYLERGLPGGRELNLLYGKIPQHVPPSKATANGISGSILPDSFQDELLATVICGTFLAEGLVRSAAEFAQRRDQYRASFPAAVSEFAELLHELLLANQSLEKSLAGLPDAFRSSRDDAREQLTHLIHRGFIQATPAERLKQFPRYLKALQLRLLKLRDAPVRDQQHTALIQPLWQNYLTRLSQFGASPALLDYRWMLEELRVSLFAQEVKTPVPVSPKRVAKLWEDIQRGA